MFKEMENLYEWLFINWLWDFIKLIIWWFFWWFWYSFYNKIIVKWNKNNITQKWKGNYTKTNWYNNTINQEK